MSDIIVGIIVTNLHVHYFNSQPLVFYKTNFQRKIWESKNVIHLLFLGVSYCSNFGLGKGIKRYWWIPFEIQYQFNKYYQHQRGNMTFSQLWSFISITGSTYQLVYGSYIETMYLVELSCTPAQPSPWGKWIGLSPKNLDINKRNPDRFFIYLDQVVGNRTIQVCHKLKKQKQNVLAN